ncbi:MAG: hemolysin family protein [bacterium]|nr:hemolysin family protein [bacterium]MDI1337037.1 hemolysin family protein [Lacunisphaera sp.]
MHGILGNTLQAFGIVALVLANGFFVAAEFGLVKLRASQLQPLVKKGKAGWRLRMALWATQHLGAVLSASQLGVTLASLGLGWVGEPFLAHQLGPVLARWGVTDPAMVSSLSFVVAFTVITFVHITFGELGPKALAIQRPKGVALWTSAPLVVFYCCFYPFIWLLNTSANLLLGAFGLKPAGESDHALGAEELEYVFSHARHTHPGDALINKLMVQSLRVRATTAQQIMRPRDQVVALWLDRPLAENLRIAQTNGHSRYPVCSGSLDKVEGLLLIREWLWQINALGPEASFEPLMRPALEFTLTTPIHTMIERFRTARSHLAVVLDDRQALAGIVTFEDVLEEIVGDIRDETDIESGPIYERTTNAITVSATLTMRELQAETGWPLEWTPRETVATWTVRHFGRLPKRGDTTTVGEYRLNVTEANAERPRRVRIERTTPDTNPAR